MRILVLIAIGLLLYIIISNYLRRQKVMKSQDTPSAEKMVKCKYCGLHILEQEALTANNNFYCSQEHLEADQNPSQ